MGHDHIRFVLMVAFFFSTCLIASFGSEMEIIRFSGTYPLTHSERVVQVTESITGSEKEEKVTKVASLVPEKKKRRRSRRRRTSKEFQMRQKSGSYEIVAERQKQTFTLTAASTMAQGTSTDQQDLCWSRAAAQQAHLPDCDSSIHDDGGGQQSNSNHESSQEFTATYPDSSSHSSSCSSTLLVCQKVSFLQQKLSELTIRGKQGRNENDVVGEVEGKKEEQQQEDRHETQSPLNDANDDQPYKPIFFVYPPKRPVRSSRKKKVGNDDGMDYYYQPTFHLDFSSSSSSSSSSSTKGIDDSDSSIFWEYDPRISGGFDSYGEDVSFYFGSASRRGNEQGVSTGKGKDSSSSSIANASSYDELCKALLLEYG